MVRRSEDWNVGLAEDLQDPEFAREYLIAAMLEEELPLQFVLGSAIRAIGVKEFAEKAGMAAPNVLRAINQRHNPTQETLDRLLKPFGLRLGLAPIVPVKTKGRRSKAERTAPAREARRRAGGR
jgi:DNA-binding phage protein